MAGVKGQALLWQGFWRGWHVHTFGVEEDQLVIAPRDEGGPGEPIKLDLADCVIEGTDDLRFTIIHGEHKYHFQAASSEERQRLVVGLSSAKIFSKSLIDAQTLPEQTGSGEQSEHEDDTTLDTAALREQIKGIVNNLQRYVRATEQTLANFKLPAKAAVQASELHYNFNCIMQSCEDLTSALSIVDDMALAGVPVRDVKQRLQHAPANGRLATTGSRANPVLEEAGQGRGEARQQDGRALQFADSRGTTREVLQHSDDRQQQQQQEVGDVGEVFYAEDHQREMTAPPEQGPEQGAGVTSHADAAPPQRAEHIRDEAEVTPQGQEHQRQGGWGKQEEGSAVGDRQAKPEERTQEGHAEDEETGLSSGHDDADAEPATFFRKASPSFMQFAHYDPTTSGPVNTRVFLDACSEILPLISQLGTTLSPVRSDIQGNIKKLERAFEKAPEERTDLGRLIQHEIDANTTTARDSATDALLWLRRALEFIEHFLLMLSEGETHLGKAAGRAYEISLRKHHNWMVRQVFSLAMRSLPDHQEFLEFLGPASDTDQTLRDMQAYALGMRNARLSVLVPEPAT